MDSRFYLRPDRAVARLRTEIAGLRSNVTTDITQVSEAAADATEVATTAAQATTMRTAIGFKAIPSLIVGGSVDVVVPLWRTMPDNQYTPEITPTFATNLVTLTVKTKTATSVTVTVTAVLAVGGGALLVAAHY